MFVSIFANHKLDFQTINTILIVFYLQSGDSHIIHFDIIFENFDSEGVLVIYYLTVDYFAASPF